MIEGGGGGGASAGVHSPGALQAAVVRELPAGPDSAHTVLQLRVRVALTEEEEEQQSGEESGEGSAEEEESAG